MPFTPFHLGGPVLLLGITVWLSRGNMDDFWKNTGIYWVLIFLGSVIPDVQGFYSVFFDRSVELHGFSHTIVGSLVYAVVLTLIFQLIKLIMLHYNTKEYWLNKYRLNFYTSSITIVFFVLCFSIIALHLIPDVFIYDDMQMLWPFSTVSIGVMSNYSIVAFYLAIAFLIGATLLLLKLIKVKLIKT
jgi:hypothetical protein